MCRSSHDDVLKSKYMAWRSLSDEIEAETLAIGMRLAVHSRSSENAKTKTHAHIDRKRLSLRSRNAISETDTRCACRN